MASISINLQKNYWILIFRHLLFAHRGVSLWFKPDTIGWRRESPSGTLGTAGGAHSSPGTRRGDRTEWAPHSAAPTCTRCRCYPPACALTAEARGRRPETVQETAACPRVAGATPLHVWWSHYPIRSAPRVSTPRMPRASRGAPVPSDDHYLHNITIPNKLYWIKSKP